MGKRKPFNRVKWTGPSRRGDPLLKSLNSSWSLSSVNIISIDILNIRNCTQHAAVVICIATIILLHMCICKQAQPPVLNIVNVTTCCELTIK